MMKKDDYTAPKYTTKPNHSTTLSFKASIRELSTDFHEYTREELSTIFEYCSQDLSLTHSILRETPYQKVKKLIVQFYRGEIEAITSGECNFVEEVIEIKKEEFIPTGPNFFSTKLQPELIHYIFDFLDPLSLTRARLLCKEFNEVTLHPSLYKKFCLKLYHAIPPLPKKCPFTGLITYLNNATYGEYPNEIIIQANADVRSVVWLPSLKSYYTPNSYYKEFTNFKGVFMNAPRVRYNGVYIMKGKYVRAGARDMGGFYDPCHMVEFYRYFRFLPDGTAISAMSVNKVKPEKMAETFSVKKEKIDQNFEEEKSEPNKSTIKTLHFGEYIVQKTLVHVRTVSKGTLYEFTMEIQSSSLGAFDQLRLESQNMRNVGSESTTPIFSDTHGSKIFKFVKLKELENDIDRDIASVSV